MTSFHTISVSFKPKVECLEAFNKVMQSVKAELPEVKGCEGVQVMAHQNDPSAFLLIEDWQSPQLHAEHLAHLVASGAWAGLEEMLIEPPHSITLTRL